MPTEDTNTPPTGTEGQSTDANGSGNPGTPPPPQDKLFTQADLEKKIEERLKRERDTAAAKSAKDKEAADQERAKQQGEWQQLAQTHEARVKELEASQTQHEATKDGYAKALARRIKAETKGWPEEARSALPDTDDPLELEAAVEKIRPLAERLAGTPRQPGNGLGPRPAGGTPGGKTEVDAQRDQLRATGRYTA